MHHSVTGAPLVGCPQPSYCASWSTHAVITSTGRHFTLQPKRREGKRCQHTGGQRANATIFQVTVMLASDVAHASVVSFKQASLIAAGIYCLWKLRCFIKCVFGCLSLSRHLLMNARENVCGCRADADLSLLSKGLPPLSAFEDKVVWITGASQVLLSYPAVLFLLLPKVCLHRMMHHMEAQMHCDFCTSL